MAKGVFGFDAPEDSPGFLLWQTTVTWQRLIKKVLEPYELSHPQFVILAISLWYTQQEKIVIQANIIQQSKLDKMTVSQSLKKLVAMGLVKRAEHHEDTRAKTVQLTPKGFKLTMQLVPIIENIDAKFFGVLKKSDQQTLITLLNQCIASA